MNAPDPIRAARSGVPEQEPAALQRELRRLQAALDGSRTATWEWNVQTGETRFDARWAAIVGYDLAELAPVSIDTWLQLLHPDDHAVSAQALQRHFDGETDHYDIQCRMRHRDGSWRWVHDRGRLFSRSADGAPLWMAGTHDDITEHKEAELAARRDHALMQALFQLVPFGVQLIDVRQGRSVAVNPALVQITGYSAQELLEGDARARFPERWWSVRASWFVQAREQGRFGPSEVQYRHAAGHLLNLVFSGVRVDGDDAALLWLCVQDVTAFRAMEAELRAAASTDRLTGLANRAMLMAELQGRIQGRIQGCSQDPIEGQAEGPAQPLALLFFDFDRFKLVNDTLGHEAGDELLRAIAARLRGQLQQLQAEGLVGPAQLARFGGDEFVLLLAGIGEAWQAWPVAQALLGSLAAPYTLRQQAIQSSASIGIALWQPGEAMTPEALLREADTAMYEAKRQGRGRAVLFDAAMRWRAQRAAWIEAALPDALAAGQLAVAWQPIVTLQGGRLLGAEALMRWTHPVLGEVAPAEFIPVAEESGQMVELGAWMLRQACRQWRCWQEAAPALAPPVVSVNLSRIELAHTARLLQTLQAALTEAGMPPAALQLEYAEHELVKDVQGTLERLRELAALGLRLALDDFGTGHAALGCLPDAPFHAVKIDHTFVAALLADARVRAVAQATVQALDVLGLVSVADGVQRADDLALLRTLGCAAAQGMAIGAPMAADALLAWRG